MCEHFKIKERAVEWNYWIHYVSKLTLKEENRCDLICNETIQSVCSVLGVFAKFDKSKALEREKIRLEKIFKKG